MSLGAWLPSLNALLNAASLGLLLLGYRAIRRGQRATHRRRMLGAVTVSAVFLVAYLVRVALTGTHRFPDVGLLKTFYLAVLFTHMVLAVAVVPFVLRLVFLASRERFESHKRLARWVWPVWVYVSATGVLVYLLLYHVAPRLQS